MTTRKRMTGMHELPGRVKALAEFRYQLRRFLSFSEEAAERAGISVQQYQLLQVVAAAPSDIQVSISYVAERMVLRHNSAVELVGRAERSGLVRRQEDLADHRRSLVTLTPEGEAMLGRLVREHWMELESQGPELMTALERLLGDGLMMNRLRNESR